MVIQERNEVRDGALKVNVVFPKRIVGIDQQGLRAIQNLLPRASCNMIARKTRLGESCFANFAVSFASFAVKDFDSNAVRAQRSLLLYEHASELC